MKHPMARTLVAVLLVVGFGQSCMSQDREIPEHARKIMGYFEGMESWPERAPGDIACKPGELKALRAVYDRRVNMNTDEPQQVKATWEIDQVLWEGRPVTLLAWFSSGDVKPRTSVGYVDPNNGDIYSLESDVGDKMIVFAHDANGNVAPKRELHTLHRVYNIAVDEARSELFVTVEFPSEVDV